MNTKVSEEDVCYDDLRLHPPASPAHPISSLGRSLSSAMHYICSAAYRELCSAQKIWLLGRAMADCEGDPEESATVAAAFYDLAGDGGLSAFDRCLLLTRLMAAVEHGLEEEPDEAPGLLALCLDERLLDRLRDPTRQQWFTSVLRRVVELSERGAIDDAARLAPLVHRIEDKTAGVEAATFRKALEGALAAIR